jgi:hypothetical protein
VILPFDRGAGRCKPTLYDGAPKVVSEHRSGPSHVSAIEEGGRVFRTVEQIQKGVEASGGRRWSWASLGCSQIAAKKNTASCRSLARGHFHCLMPCVKTLR